METRMERLAKYLEEEYVKASCKRAMAFPDSIREELEVAELNGRITALMDAAWEAGLNDLYTRMVRPL